jgi:subtilase family serine protease
MTLTVALKLHNPQAAETMLTHVSTPGDALYRHFLTLAQFQTRFGPTDADVATVTAALTAYGLTVERVSTTTLHVTGTQSAIERAFQVSLHQFNVAATKAAAAYSFHAPAQPATLPPAIAGLVHGVFGLSDRPVFAPHLRHASGQLRPASVKPAVSSASKPPDPLGFWTTVDFGDYYDVKPLYKAGITGAGQTIGIATLASFTPSDAYTYWYAAGIKVPAKRVRVYNVDGGAGPPSDDAGSGETTLDVEQSGGVAPDAKILVYVAPNTDPGFVDLFAKVIDENLADAISCSWGSWEWFNDLANGPVREKGNPDKVSMLDAIHALFVQAGIQGQSVFTSSGDAGAYDANDGFSLSDYSLTLSVDYPASDPANTAAGGTTLPGMITFVEPPITVTIPAERVWSWDYLIPLCDAFDENPIECGIFPVGSGGGVSIEFGVPSYQSGLAGVQVSQPNQVFSELDTIPPQILYTLPSGYAGRNVPDISFNADPDTGYLIGYTSSEPGSTFGYLTYYGGTSFVGPQLNGVTQLLAQKSGGRMGFLNPTLYALAAQPSSYHGPTASLNYIKTGNNDFYYGHKSYTPATGLGTIDVAKLANAIATPK